MELLSKFIGCVLGIWMTLLAVMLGILPFVAAGWAIVQWLK